jgi:hypothetical protein
MEGTPLGEVADLREYKENVDLVRRAFAEYGLSVSGLREFVRSGLVAPDVEFDISPVYPDAPIIRGVEEWLDFVEALPRGRFHGAEPERFFNVDDERVLVFRHGTAQGVGSGAPSRSGMPTSTRFETGPSFS